MLMELSLFQTYAGQTCVNRWNYLATGTPAAVTLSFALVEAVGGIAVPVVNTFPEGTLMEAIRDAQHSGVVFQALTAKAVYDVTDFYELPYVPGPVGQQTGSEGLSPTAAYGFRSSRTRTDIRRGMKRFTGVPELYSTQGGILGNGITGVLNTIATAMSAVVTYDDEGNTLSFAPCVVSKEEYPVPGKTTTAYRYYPTLVEQMEHVAQSVTWQPYAQTRTQVSRQYGRGQ